MKTISSEAYLAFDGTKFFDRDACRKYEQDEVLKPIAEGMAGSLRMECIGSASITFPYRVSAKSVRQFLRENRQELLGLLQGMSP